MKGRREVKKAGKRARGQYTQRAREEKEKKNREEIFVWAREKARVQWPQVNAAERRLQCNMKSFPYCNFFFFVISAPTHALTLPKNHHRRESAIAVAENVTTFISRESEKMLLRFIVVVCYHHTLDDE